MLMLVSTILVLVRFAKGVGQMKAIIEALQPVVP